MGKYNINYCKTNKVAIFVQNEEQIKELEKLAKPKSKENWKRYFDNNKNWYIILSDNYNYDFSIQGELWMKIDEYEKITFNTFIEDNIETIPEKWCFTTTEESQDLFINWYVDKYKKIKSSLDIQIGNHYCIDEKTNQAQGWMHYAPERKKGYTEITFEQFKEKILNMNTEKKVIGWKLKEDCKQYEKAAVEVCKQNGSKEIEDFKVSDDTSFGINAVCIDWLKKAGVLELWFEKVYEEKYKVGDYITVVSKVGGGYNGDIGKTYKVQRVSEDGYLFYEFNSSIDPENVKVRKATQEEIKASQQKVIIVNNTEIVIKKGSMFAVDKEFNIDYLLVIKELFDTRGYPNMWVINVETVKLGCKQGWNRDHINKIIEEYKEFNK